jgi:signal transduction histidine kinase
MYKYLSGIFFFILSLFFIVLIYRFLTDSEKSKPIKSDYSFIDFTNFTDTKTLKNQKDTLKYNSQKYLQNLFTWAYNEADLKLAVQDSLLTEIKNHPQFTSDPIFEILHDYLYLKKNRSNLSESNIIKTFKIKEYFEKTKDTTGLIRSLDLLEKIYFGPSLKSDTIKRYTGEQFREEALRLSKLSSNPNDKLFHYSKLIEKLFVTMDDNFDEKEIDTLIEEYNEISAVHFTNEAAKYPFYTNLGIVKIMAGNEKEGYALLKKAIQIDSINRYYAYFNALLHAYEKDYFEDAEKWVNGFYTTYFNSNLDNKDMLAEVDRINANLLFNKNKYDEGLQFINRSDSLFNVFYYEKSLKDIEDIKAKYDFNKIENENLLIQQKNQILSIGSVILIFLLLILGFFIYYVLNLKKREKEYFMYLDSIYTMLAHDMQSPISAIRAGVEYVKEKIVNNEPDQAIVFMSKINNSINKLEYNTKNFLYFGRAYNSKQKPSDIKIPISNIKDFFTFNHLNAENISINYQLSSENIIIRYPESLEIIIRNWILNAIKHSGAKQISIEISRIGKIVKIKIQDDGKIIPEESLQQIRKAITDIDDNQHKRDKKYGLFLINKFLNFSKSTAQVEITDNKNTFIIKTS